MDRPPPPDLRSMPDLRNMIADGAWFAHRYDEAADAIQFRHLDRADHRRVTFLTDGEIGDAPLRVVARADALSEARSLAPLTPRFIFHSAYCCSTLLARAFDLPGAAMGLKEPQILNDAIGLRLRDGDPRQVAAALDAALWLLARPLGAGEVNVVKPSNVVNPLIPAILALRPDARAVLLHAPLDAFLGSVARKEIEGRAWVRELMWKLIRLGLVERFGFSEEELYRHSDLQVAALGWLAQHALFADLAASHPDRVRTLDSDVLTARPHDCIAALGSLFGIDLEPAAVVAGPAFRLNSKTQDAFGTAERAADQARGLALHAREIAIVLEWAHAVAAHAAVPRTLPAPLLG